MTDTDVDSETAAVMRYDSGAFALINSSMTMAGSVRADIHGSHGRIEIDGPFYEQTTFRILGNDGAILSSYSEKIQGRGMQYQALHVEECIAQGLQESPIMSVAETVKIMEVMEQIHPF